MLPLLVMVSAIFYGEIKRYNHGLRKRLQLILPVFLEEAYDDMTSARCFLTCEQLGTGQWSITVSNSEEDVDIVICDDNVLLRGAAIQILLDRKHWQCLQR